MIGTLTREEYMVAITPTQMIEAQVGKPVAEQEKLELQNRIYYLI